MLLLPSSTEGGIWRSCCDQIREIVLRSYSCLISSRFFSFFSRLHVAFLTRAERTKQCYLNWEKKGISRETSHQTSYHRYDLNIRSPSSCLVEGSPSMRRREPSHDTSLFGRRRNMSSMTTIGEDWVMFGKEIPAVPLIFASFCSRSHDFCSQVLNERLK